MANSFAAIERVDNVSICLCLGYAIEFELRLPSEKQHFAYLQQRSAVSLFEFLRSKSDKGNSDNVSTSYFFKISFVLPYFAISYGK